MGVSIDLFIPEIVLLLPDVPDTIIAQQVVSVAAHFCYETGVWREVCAVTGIAGSHEATVTLPPDTEMVAIVKASYADAPLNLAGDENLLTPPEGARANTVFGIDGSLYFDGFIKNFDELEVMVSLMPSTTATTIPNAVYHGWKAAITAGVAANLLMVTSTKQANGNLSSYYKSVYDDAIRVARARVGRAKTNAARTIVYGGL